MSNVFHYRCPFVTQQCPNDARCIMTSRHKLCFFVLTLQLETQVCVMPSQCIYIYAETQDNFSILSILSLFFLFDSPGISVRRGLSTQGIKCSSHGKRIFQDLDSRKNGSGAQALIQIYIHEIQGGEQSGLMCISSKKFRLSGIKHKLVPNVALYIRARTITQKIAAILC